MIESAEMGATIEVIGAMWGDEGKAKIIDGLAADEDNGGVGRGQGGGNAGHNVQIPGRNNTYATHQIPSGLFTDSDNFIGMGTATDPVALLDEIGGFNRLGKWEISPRNLKVSPRTQVTIPSHLLIDEALDVVGTTHRGVGPTYTDKASRDGVRMIDVLTHPECVEVLAQKHRKKLQDLGRDDLIERMGSHDKFFEAIENIRQYVIDPEPFIREILASGKNFIAEGAQAILLGADTGTYPFVTSSNTNPGGVIGGIDGLPVTSVKDVLGVYKLFTTRVGAGPFPTAMGDEDADIAELLTGERGTPGAEYGATTGRRRSAGWIDGVAGKYSARMGRFTGLALTKLDVFDGFEEIKVCVAYNIDGQEVTEYPDDIKALERAKPVYKILKGWDVSTKGAQSIDDLPGNAVEFVKFFSRLMDVKISLIGTGIGRKDLIRL